MGIVVLQQIFALNASRLIDHIFEKGYRCTIGEVFRTEEQARSYASRGIGVINSQHCKRLAIDLNIFSPGGMYLEKTEDLRDFGAYWESLHPLNRWGGNFQHRADGNHFEMQEER